MESRPKGGRARIVLLIAGLVMGALLISPAGAHVGGSVGHLWKKHIRPLAVKTFYTKKQANNRFGPRAYAVVSRSPDVAFMPEKRVKNFASVSRPSTGVYCLVPKAGSGIDTTKVNVQVSVEWGNSSGHTLAAYWQGSSPSFGCPPGEIEIRTYDFDSNLSNSVAFSVAVF